MVPAVSFNANLPPDLRVYYRIDAHDRIVDVDEEWERIACEGPRTCRHEVVGQDLFDFVVGDATRMYLTAAFMAARTTGTDRIHTYRCDTPTLKREMRMTVHPEEDGGITVRHELIRSTPLKSPRHFVTDEQAGWLRCSVCLRLRHPRAGLWLSPESARALGADPVRVTYGVCARCDRAREGQPASDDINNDNDRSRPATAANV